MTVKREVHTVLVVQLANGVALGFYADFDIVLAANPAQTAGPTEVVLVKEAQPTLRRQESVRHIELRQIFPGAFLVLRPDSPEIREVLAEICISAVRHQPRHREPALDYRIRGCDPGMPRGDGVLLARIHLRTPRRNIACSGGGRQLLIAPRMEVTHRNRLSLVIVVDLTEHFLIRGRVRERPQVAISITADSRNQLQ